MFELRFQNLGVVCAEVNQGTVALTPGNLTQAAASGLQHHVGGAVAFLREDNAGQTAAVPAFFANLHEQHNAVRGAGCVQRRKGGLCSLRGFVVGVPTVVFKYLTRGKLLNQRGNFGL